MAVTVSDIVHVMDQIAPPYLAEDWDNAGLQIGDHQWPVRTVAVALDPSLEVIKEARDKNADLLITHHPLIFRPLPRIDFGTPIGAIIKTAAKYQMAIFAAHTNLDKSEGGSNDLLARRIGLQDLKFLQYSNDVYPLFSIDHRQGIGRVGVLKKAIELQALALKVKTEFHLQHIKFVGRPDLVITKVAVCTGSGSSLLNSFYSSGAQAYISGDLKYHDARDVEAAGLGLIDMGHFSSEYLVVKELVKRLTHLLAEKQLQVEVRACEIEKDPFVVF
jgi:dinuclear metal center YbgI/SA1388 family protein